jgi:sarcosine oxidase subunit alpha
MPLARTPLHDWHASHGAEFHSADGWQVVWRYHKSPEEPPLLRRPVVIADISANPKLSVLGSGVKAFAAKLLGLSPIRKVRGACDMEPTSRDLVCRLTENSLLLLALTPDQSGLAARIADAMNVTHLDVTTAYAGFSLIGTRAAEVLQPLTELDLSPQPFPKQSCVETNLAGVHALLVRPRRSGMDEILVYVGWDVGEYVWERIWNTGAPLGLSAIGATEWSLNFAGPSG